MKFPLLILFLFLSLTSFSQGFILDMSVMEMYDKETTIFYPSTKVICGIKKDTICLAWTENIICLSRNTKSIKPSLRKEINKYVKVLESTNKDEKDRQYIYRDVFYNKWGELFLISIYAGENILIYVNRLDDNYPHFFFKNVPRKQILKTKR